MGIGVCSNLASSGDPHSSQNYFNHRYRHRVRVRVGVRVRARARDFLLMRYINLHLLTYLLTYLLTRARVMVRVIFGNLAQFHFGQLTCNHSDPLSVDLQVAVRVACVVTARSELWEPARA